LANLPL